MLKPVIKWTDIQIDITDKCNAACLYCSRNDPGRVINTDLTPEDMKKIMDSDVKSIEMCGNYGDASANRYLFEILESLDCNIKIFTNGSAHSPSYWKKLANLMGENPVLFALDGNDKETYERYRVNCIWEKTLENAQAFIDAGGWAVWSMVLFDWNIDQHEEAQKRAKDMGFSHFHTIYSSRNVKRGTGTHKIGTDTFDKVVPLCLERQRLFITAQGNVFPCCWMASDYEGIHETPNIKDYESLRSLLESDKWNQYWNSIDSFDHKICRKKCGKNKRDYKVITSFNDRVYDQPCGSNTQSITSL